LTSLDSLRGPDARRVLYECIAGSRAYGTANAASDEDVRGIFAVPAGAYLSLARPPDQVGDERGNTVFYSLRRTIELLSVANPNILELLFMPTDCERVVTPAMRLLIDRRDMFITKQCSDTHAGYAMSQIKKARGQNKWINNPKPEQGPAKEAYCHVVPWDPGRKQDEMPMRPVSLRSLGWELSEFHAAKLEHARDAYRLYRYGIEARGVFRGDVIACESIPKADEMTRFAGVLFFNEQGWKQALVDHQNYWAWRRDRNPARWEQQERGELDFDAKNLMHTVRLLLSARSILREGRPLVRVDGEDRRLLLSIRAGERSFEDILRIADGLMAECDSLRTLSSLPEVCDGARASRLLREVTEAWESQG
jgi:hypothetical protein